MAAVSSHGTYFPAQVAIPNADGQLLREYWHSGHLAVENHERRLLAGILHTAPCPGASDAGPPEYRLTQGEEQGTKRYVFP